MARRSDHTPEALRGLILEAAEAILAAEGLAGLSARAIAKRIGYSPGTIYNLFQNLDEVVLTVEAAVLDRLADQLRSVPPLADPVAQLKQLAAVYLAFTQSNQRLWSVLFEHYLPPGVPAPDWYVDKLHHLLALVEAALVPLCPPGRESDAADAARVLWASVHGIASLAAADKLSIVTSASAGRMIDDLISNYLAGLAARAAAPVGNTEL
jgi:AcrR family transcriptional regulator